MKKASSKTSLFTKAAGRLWAVGAMFIIAAGFLWIGMVPLAPPPALPENAASDVFSAGRAFRHVEAISQSPRPIGSVGHSRTAEYITAELKLLGIETMRQEATAAFSPEGRIAISGRVVNIAGRIKGANGGGSIVLVAHYDSEPTTCGAGDNGAAVAALLETARALSLDRRFKNDVIFLFSDGEETDLLGARAFVSEHPWAANIGLILNFEARGVSGPSIMFQTFGNDLQLARGFSRSAGRPVAYSFSNDIYRLMGNITDFNVFKGAGIPGCNFAFMDGAYAYGNMFDVPGNLENRSLQHHGDYALGLVSSQGDEDLSSLRRQSDAVFFSLPWYGLAVYSRQAATPLAVCITLLFFLLLAWGVKKDTLSIKGVLGGSLAALLSIIAASVAAHFLWQLLKGIQPGSLKLLWNKPLFTAFVLLGLSLTAMVQSWAAGKTGLKNLMAGWLFLIMLALAAANLWAPGASYLFAWPLLGGLAGLGLLMLESRSISIEASTTAAFALWAGPALVLAAPALYLVFTAMTLELTGLLMVPAILFSGPLVQLILMISKKRGMALGASLFVLFLVLTGLECFRLNAEKDFPREDVLFYCLNADSSAAIWASPDAKPDEWTKGFLGPQPSRKRIDNYLPVVRTREFLVAPAQFFSLTAPEIKVTGDRDSSGFRKLSLQVKTLRQALVLYITVDPKAEILGTTIDGKAVPFPIGANRAETSSWSIDCYNPSPKGVEVALLLKTLKPVAISVTDRTEGFDSLPGFNHNHRPPHITPAPVGFGNAVFVGRTYNF